ncbi:leucine efflux protein LeuE [Sutterella sp.]|uniref:leucine efflux protein LeuE n=1 Tax=Sutterella sp. TaxID=1981025 RepID=UPI0026E0D2AD|nr:leucine efflux protein LeuE [Sutterella sp.]MDO5531473.1 leucine efflux protein LeuE [Sutterella sp.]
MLEQFGIIDPWLYAAGALLIVLAPGPSMVFVLKTSLTEGRARGFAGMAGVMTGDSVFMFLSWAGLAAVIEAHPAFFDVIRVAGGLYLAWIGAKELMTLLPGRATAGKKEGEGSPSGSAWRAYRAALLITLTNPKSILFFVAFFIQFIDVTYAHTWISYLILALILQVFSAAVLSIVITLGADCLRVLGAWPLAAKAGSLALGGLFLWFGLRLVADAL